eukprot:749738-Hanusia_phi.AAC.2
MSAPACTSLPVIRRPSLRPPPSYRHKDLYDLLPPAGCRTVSVPAVSPMLSSPTLSSPPSSCSPSPLLTVPASPSCSSLPAWRPP